MPCSSVADFSTNDKCLLTNMPPFVKLINDGIDRMERGGGALWTAGQRIGH